MEPWAVVGVGARASNGLNAVQIAQAIRAGLYEPRSYPVQDRFGREVGVCRVGGLPDDCVGPDRLLRLAAPPLREVCASLEAPPALVLCLPEAGRPDDDDRLGPSFVAELAHDAGVALDLDRSRIVRRGHAGFGWALSEAGPCLDGGPVVVGGVDSYLHPDMLRALDAGYRLHSLQALDGMVPGEAAAFVALARGATGPAAVTAFATEEETTITTGEPNLVRALTAAIAAVGGGDDSWVLSDQTHERHRRREWSFVATRHRLTAHGGLRLPQVMGDVGAASGPMLVAYAREAIAGGFARGSRALLLLSSEGEERAAVVVEATS